MRRILEGVLRFQREVYPTQKQLFAGLAHQQDPDALFITCSDSRVVPNLITQTDPGELFLCRNAGNIIPPYGELHGGVSATIEYAVLALNVKNIIVCGHSDCGAMKGIRHPDKVSDMPTVASWLRNADSARRVVQENYAHLPEEEQLRVLTEENVIAQMANLRTHPSVAARLARGQIRICGWVYDIACGKVRAYNEERAQFLPVESTDMPALVSRPALRPVTAA